MTILVTGATGNVGRLVVRDALGRGARVRALTRNPGAAGLPAGAEVVAGDLERPGSLRAALEGVERMFLFPFADTAREVVALAREAGVRRLVVLSSAAVTDGSDTTHHLPVERAAEESGLEWTHVRPGEFMLNKLFLWGPSIRAERVVRDPFPDTAWAPVHEQDIADTAVAALLEDGLTGRALTLNGPAVLGHAEQVAAIAAAIGEEVRHEAVTREEARALYRAQGGFAEAVADFLLGYVSYDGAPVDAATDPGADPEANSGTNGASPEGTSPGGASSDGSDGGSGFPGEDVPPGLRDALGRPGRTFASWARDHAADFR
ncbi:SDR family oxidoreductase [Streptomyces clavuligerus]|uniref:Predicted nucleoside-diphosphate sugar epimerase n=1 Tax=Streptomyces clavuligerus TaxID=1901 RepID=E2Q604_STRCL|nr:NAD(P)H-binding protein [Streptomyces clavuligerus]ANW21655.1 NmrA family transcriptional regulator [Streptomyces clavuligerus]AXU16283.1 NAD-dependent epimerase/dehydratase family protein [Streptomyces clavuligerus]EFG05164.1 Predicted nucleoside-diphosphate sugar epimerase [Streptomyces clavuligerus]MBY6306442.1 NAD(P)H-binding protein [Streptomyces clavuligerus]QCS09062.1 NmrA family transcriptional regulator [Streptomyces clavuligerus]